MHDSHSAHLYRFCTENVVCDVWLTRYVICRMDIDMLLSENAERVVVRMNGINDKCELCPFVPPDDVRFPLLPFLQPSYLKSLLSLWIPTRPPSARTYAPALANAIPHNNPLTLSPISALPPPLAGDMRRSRCRTSSQIRSASFSFPFTPLRSAAPDNA